MSLLKRFFSRSPRSASSPDPATLPGAGDGLGLQVLFDGGLPLEPSLLEGRLRQYHRSMARATVDLSPEIAQDGTLFGLAAWGSHVVRLVGFSLPMPQEAVETCIAPSHYPQPLKARARSHASHLLMYYAGSDSAPLEQFVAMAALGGVLSHFGASVVLNESGHTSFPAEALAGLDVDGDTLELLRTLPLPILYCGFVKHEVAGVEGVWMRTYGAELLQLPNLAVHARGHNEGQKHFDRVSSILGYILDSHAIVEAGHTMEIGSDDLIRFRRPKAVEEFLTGPNEPLVIESIEHL